MLLPGHKILKKQGILLNIFNKSYSTTPAADFIKQLFSRVYKSTLQRSKALRKLTQDLIIDELAN